MAVLDVVVPDSLGEVDECVVVTWLKREGDPVAMDETLVIIQAAKTSVELPAPQAGQVTHILAQQGDVVHKGQTLAQMEVTEVIAQPARPVEQPPVPVGDSATVRSSPIARRLASEHGVDLTQVTGSGALGRITEKDVLAFVKARRSETSSAAAGEVVVPTPITAVESAAFPPAASATIPMAGTRAIIARRMLQSLQSMAQLTLHTESDITDLVRLRERLKAQFPVSYTDLVVRASALALRQHPRLNAILDGEVIRLIPDIHVGIAVALEDGLVVPVVHNADRQNLAGITAARIRLTDRARAGQLSQAEVTGGTFTVTNLGSFDVDGFTPIINPPEIAILGVGRIVEKLVIYQGKVAQRAMMTLSLTFDHRLVDGAPAAAFLQTIKRLLEAPDGSA
jgi:pyruvate dehydrogenase E2 component (dihydrolipoamide acetyltransferase)